MKDDRGFIKKILDYCDLISSDLSGLGGDFESFMSDEKVQRLCSFSLIQIGSMQDAFHMIQERGILMWIGLASSR